MARKKSSTLTDSEMRLMRIIWDTEPCTVNDVVDRLPADEPLAYSTVLTTMRILEEKGYVEHRKNGRAFVYSSLSDPQEVRTSALQHMMDKFFDNSKALLLANVLEEGDLSHSELDAIKSLLEAHTSEKNAAEGTHSGAQTSLEAAKHNVERGQK